MKLFVWDFHGVLEKDNEKAVIDISNSVLAEAGHRERFTNEDNEKYYGLKWYQYFEHLLPNCSHEEHLKLQNRCFAYTEQHLNVLAKYIKPNDHAIEVLTRIHDTGHIQIVISNTRQKDLIWFLEAVGIRQFFDEDHIVGVNAHQKYGTKLDVLKQYLKDKMFDMIVVIGDSDDDLIMGKSIGGMTYFYKHPHRVHNKTKFADHITNDLRDVLQELK
jgi:phosphoglycolate phosphatase-like HAD superfamily hydrolase